MLLLVLILVLIAFGLLVVALLSGSVLWAWVSVGVSVAAAAVLLIDWLQRRSAVRAGAEAAAVPAAEPPRPRMHDPEPVTEVLPVIPRSADAPARSGEGPTGDRYDDTSDTTRTVVMPVVQPSASAERPPGASREIAPSSGDSSLSVTKTGIPATASTPSTGAEEGSPANDAAPTTAAPTEAGPNGRADDAADQSPTTMAPAAREPDAAPEAGATDAAPATGEAYAAEEAAPADETAGTGVEAAGATAGKAETAAAAAEQKGADPAGAEANGTAAEPAAAAASDAEPPEEQREPAAAAVVAGLEAEVLVVDEQPRYHLSSCRALAGKATIPLPVREAVELGFTPCGWCGPDRALAERHPARAQ